MRCGFPEFNLRIAEPTSSVFRRKFNIFTRVLNWVVHPACGYYRAVFHALFVGCQLVTPADKISSNRLLSPAAALGSGLQVHKPTKAWAPSRFGCLSFAIRNVAPLLLQVRFFIFWELNRLFVCLSGYWNTIPQRRQWHHLAAAQPRKQQLNII